MQLRPLNIENALRLASMLSKYIDVNKLDPDQEALDFVDDIVQRIDAQDYVDCIKIMANKTEEDLEEVDGYSVFALFTEGLRGNRIIPLLQFYKSLGL